MLDSEDMDDYSEDDDDILTYYNIFGFGSPDLTRPTLGARERKRRRKIDDYFFLNFMGIDQLASELTKNKDTRLTLIKTGVVWLKKHNITISMPIGATSDLIFMN